MNQPKFKFGEKVQVRGGLKAEHAFIVDDVWWDDKTGTYRYGDNWPESILDIYQEPSNKKLYAFVSTRRSNERIYREYPLGGNGWYVRDPENDKYIQ